MVNQLWPPDNSRKCAKCPPSSFHGGNAEDKTSGTLFSSTTSKWECLPWFPMNCPSWTVARCGSADSDSVMVNAWWCSTMFSSYILGILEQLVSGTVNVRRWTNCMECSFLWFKSLGFLSLWIAKVYCLCWSIQWWPGLATAKHSGSEMISTTPWISQWVRQSQ